MRLESDEEDEGTDHTPEEALADPSTARPRPGQTLCGVLVGTGIALGVVGRGHSTAPTVSISTAAPAGRSATATALRAGGSSSKYAP